MATRHVGPRHRHPATPSAASATSANAPPHAAHGGKLADICKRHTPATIPMMLIYMAAQCYQH
ncbi:MAG: hypothetical protein LBB76_06680 [Azoarcus sp.]|nr:hypothetical protein [Azoarcus sp.]